MTNSFGPWTTAMHAGANPQLSAFWKRRIVRLGDVNRLHPSLTHRSAFGLFMLGLVLGFLPTLHGIAIAQTSKSDVPAEPIRVAEPIPASENEARILKQIQTSLCDVHWVELPFEEVLQFISTTKNLPIRYDEAEFLKANARHDAPITLKASAVSFPELLQLLLEPLTLDWIVQGDGLVVTSRARAEAHVSEWIYDVRDLVQQKIPAAQLAAALPATIGGKTWQAIGGSVIVRPAGQHLVIRQSRRVHREIEAVLRDIRRALQVPAELEKQEAVLETRAYAVADLTQHGLNRNRGLEQRLAARIQQKIARPTWEKYKGAGSIRFEGDQMLVKQTQLVHERIAEVISILRRLTAADPQLIKNHIWRAISLEGRNSNELGVLHAVLNRPVSLDVIDMPLHRAFQELGGTHGVDILAEQTSLADAKIDLLKTDTVTLKLNGASLRSALKLMLEPYKLDWTIIGDRAIAVTTRAEVDSIYEANVYRVQELISPQLSETQLVARITAQTVPESWDTVGGRGSIRALPGLLIVTQNRRGHDAIGHVLEGLAESNRK